MTVIQNTALAAVRAKPCPKKAITSCEALARTSQFIAGSVESDALRFKAFTATVRSNQDANAMEVTYVD